MVRTPGAPMILSLFTAASLAASPALTVRRDCDAAGGLPGKIGPMVVVAFPSSPASELQLGTLVSTTATSSFAILLSGRIADVRTFVFVAYDVNGTALGKVLVDVDVTTGEVIALDGSGITTKFRSDARSSGDPEGEAYDVEVVLEDGVARSAVMVTLTDVTDDGALVEGDAFEQAIALHALSEKGRGLVGAYTFDDAHPVDSSRQQWSGTLPVDAALDGATLTFSASADLCLPAGVDAPADGTVEWTEALVLQGSARAPKWKSVTLGLKEAETETWLWPFSARIQDGTAEGVIVSLDAFDGAVAPRTGDVVVKVPARERLSGSASLATSSVGAGTLTVSVHPFGVPSRPLTTFVVTRSDDAVIVDTTSYLEINDEKDVIAIYDHTKEVYLYADGPGRAGAGGSATFDGETWRLSSVTLSGPEQVEWDGTIGIAVGGEAVWADLEVTASLTASLSTGLATSKATFPLTSLESVYEGTFVFDADPSGGWYGWDCIGCGDDFDPFEVEAQLGTGTRTTSGQASTKAELL